MKVPRLRLIVSGYPSDAAENAVQADVVAAGYR
ncbi:arabinofuranosidase catalytic domain-containing protein [Microbispora catharanthi]|nr:arabinofuranosidase catalytic domain-containing protein [Microbispora catharanthi]